MRNLTRETYYCNTGEEFGVTNTHMRVSPRDYCIPSGSGDLIQLELELDSCCTRCVWALTVQDVSVQDNYVAAVRLLPVSVYTRTYYIRVVSA